MRERATRVNLGFFDGGLGDNIARLPVVAWLLKTNPYIIFDIVVPNYFVELARVLLPESEKLRYVSFSDSRSPNTPEFFSLSNPSRTTRSDRHTTLKTHLVDHAFHMLADRSLTDASEKRYPLYAPIEGIRCNRVVVTTGYTAKVRQWPTGQINRIINWIIEQGYTPVLLGNGRVETGNAHIISADFDPGINTRGCIDLRGKTNLVEALYECLIASAVIGLDNGLLHLAACTTTPVVAAYTNCLPETRIPYLPHAPFIAITPKDCRGCQTTTDFTFDFDFRTCFDNENKENACAERITDLQWTTALSNVL